MTHPMLPVLAQEKLRPVAFSCSGPTLQERLGGHHIPAQRLLSFQVTQNVIEVAGDLELVAEGRLDQSLLVDDVGDAVAERDERREHLVGAAELPALVGEEGEGELLGPGELALWRECPSMDTPSTSAPRARMSAWLSRKRRA